MPICDVLAALLERYRTSADVPLQNGFFPSPKNDDVHLVDVKNPNEGVPTAHRLRHTFRTTLAILGVTSDQSRLLMGHSLGKDVAAAITSSLVIESLQPISRAVAKRYVEILNTKRVLMIETHRNR